MDLQFYLDMVDFIIESKDIVSSEKEYAQALKREIKVCMKEKKNLNSYWKLVAYKLFESKKILDARVDKDILETVEWSHEGRSFVTSVRYVDFEINKFPPVSRMVKNSLRVDDAVFVIETLKGFLDRFGHVITDRVYMLQDYMLVLLEEGELKSA